MQGARLGKPTRCRKLGDDAYLSRMVRVSESSGDSYYEADRNPTMNGTATRAARRRAATWCQHCRSSSGGQTVQSLGESQITNESDDERYCRLYIYDVTPTRGIVHQRKAPTVPRRNTLAKGS